MAGALGALVRAGLAVKLGHVRQATSSYLRDRTEEGRNTVSGYVVGGAFYAIAGIFMIAALLVGAAALFRWVEMKYGLFQAFAATGGSLVVLAALFAVMAASAMHPPRKSYPSLGSRLRVALRAGPSKQLSSKQLSKAQPVSAASSRIPANNRDHVASARNTATAILRSPASPKHAATQAPPFPLAKRAGAAAAVGLLGWALAQRYTRRAQVPPKRVRG